MLGALGLVLPGAGHWYAKEHGRGLLIAAGYWSGVAVVAGGRTDDVGHVAGAIVLGALGVSVIDGVLATGRHNARLAVSAVPGGHGSRGVVRVEIAARR